MKTVEMNENSWKNHISLLSHLLFALTIYQINAMILDFYSMVRYTEYLIYIFINIYMETLEIKEHHGNQSRTNGPINAHLTIAQVMPRYNQNNEKQEALL